MAKPGAKMSGVIDVILTQEKNLGVAFTTVPIIAGSTQSERRSWNVPMSGVFSGTSRAPLLYDTCI